MAVDQGGRWDKDLDDGVVRIVGQIQLRKYGKFMDDFAVQLKSIEQALDETVTDSWDSTLDPISLQYLPCENTTLLALISTDNKVLNKVIMVLSTLSSEMQHLCYEAKTKFYNALLFYGEGELTGNSNPEGESQVAIGRTIPLMHDLLCHVDRCYAVAKNVIQQMSALFDKSRGSSVIDVTDIHFQTVFEHLGTMLASLVTLDEIIQSQSTLREHWTLYRRMLKSVEHISTRVGTTPQDLKALEKLVGQLEYRLLQGRIFIGCVEQGFDEGKALVTKNAAFAEELALNIKNWFAQVEPRFGEMNELDRRRDLMGIYALYVLHYYIFRTIDKRLFKTLWDVYKKVAAVHVIGNILWFPDRFLLLQMPQVVKALDKKAQDLVKSQRLHFLQQKAASLPKDIQSLYSHVTTWLVRMESCFRDTDKLLEDLNRKCNILLQGVYLAWYISNQVTTIMNLHVALAKPMTKTSVLLLCKMIEMMKAIEAMFHKQTVKICDCIIHIVQHLSYTALFAVHSAKKRLVTDKKYSERKLDVLSALVLTEKCLNGPGTRERRLIIHLAMAVGVQLKNLKEDELSTFTNIMKKLDLISELHEKLHESCDSSFLYWHRVVFPIFLDDLYKSAVDGHRLHYIFAALRDCAGPISTTKHDSSPQHILDGFKQEVLSQLKENFLDQLCRDIETDLRLQTHLHLQLDDRNPFNVGLKDFSQLVNIRPIKFFDKIINIKAYVEHYLDKTFYNLTTVALHDWKTYAEMRSLAQQKYGLVTVEAHLPSQTLEQGLDVLEIMRNIHVFVSRYLYNLNNQIFIERTSNNKHLNTINIRHIANSIRTHGIGIMNTTVNFAYQFLRKKFFIFSQFLYDEHIKSRLVKDLRHFRETRSQAEPKYPFDRAEKFNRGIRKLGLTPDGESYLDQFRALISQIGNAIGYVRMIRSGGLHCCSMAIQYVPDLDIVPNFESLSREAEMSDDCIEAAKKLDSVVSGLTKNFSEGTEYFRLLVDVFAPTFRDSSNMHLRNFFVILPPLTLNYVEYAVACKERMSRKNKVGAAFTDDGFTMGVAYILKLLDQYQEFDALHWFQSVEEKFRKDKAQVNVQNKQAEGNDEKLQQAMTLTGKRLETHKHEFDLLNFSLSSARIFFRADLTAAEEKQEKGEEQQQLKSERRDTKT
ncbi:WASH complex subunit 4-like [Ornithodoros turicata]|uniref:WASH complex subunit 4-like n=1 Tax=Ornithodoros turicata TaxID=34597 RepID=UPI003139D7DF